MTQRRFNLRRLSLSIAAFAAIALAAPALAEIDYHVKVDQDKSVLLVTISIPAQKGPVSIQMPSWSPGSYSYGDFFKNVSDVTAVDAGGASLAVTHPDQNTWSVDAPSDEVVKLSYSVPIRGQRRFAQADNSFLQISGPSTYMYVVGRKPEGCKISFDVPQGWPLMLSLDADRAPNTFDAPSYDVLADAPVSTGPGLIIEQYKLHGKDHFIVIEGAARNEVDKEKLLKDCKFVTAAETDFFGSVPYHKYIWHFVTYSSPDGAGGLEHLGSTQISLASGLGPRSESVLAHEFFHLWNVKRTRAKVLGPFDYLKLPKTGALWWLEGVTDYYASLLPYRYQEWTRDQFFDGVVRNLEAVRANPARLEISPYMASYRVDEANNGRGNSQGYKISYYNLGWLAGMCLDIEIRSKTGNQHSLDDVARGLYDLCKDNKPGFEEGEIRNQCVRFGGPDLGPFFDKVVMSPGELPVEEQLAKVGLKIQESNQEYADLGFSAAPSRQAKGMSVIRIHGPAETVLQSGDVLTSINGKATNGDMRSNATVFSGEVAAAKVGTPISLEILRDGNPMTLTVTPVSTTRKVHTIVDDPAASPQAVSLRKGWLMTKSVAVQ